MARLKFANMLNGPSMPGFLPNYTICNLVSSKSARMNALRDEKGNDMQHYIFYGTTKWLAAY